VGYDVLVASGAPTHYATARLGGIYGAWDVSLFVNNLTNSRDLLNVQHTANSVLVTASTFRPREMGLTATYRH
jgi:hypothetical protein